MELSQTVGLIMGSNIGTTLTAWILSMAGIQGDNLWLSMLKPENFSPILALVGVILIMAAKSDRKKDTGSILCGFAILMFGMELMKDAMAPLTEMPGFDSHAHPLQQPLVGSTGWCSLYRHYPVLCRLRRHSSGTLHHRLHYLRHGNSHYHGAEYRYLCDRIALIHRYQ